MWQVEFQDIAPAKAEGDFVLRQGLYFRCGDYPDKEFALNEAEADTAIERFTPAPLNIEHIPSIFDGKLGEIRRLWRQGRDILAEYQIPAWLHEVTTREPIRISSEWDRRTKTAIGGALVLHPRIQDAAILSAFSALYGAETGSPLEGERAAASKRLSGSVEEWEARRERAGKGGERMSLLASIRALFRRAGVPEAEIDAELASQEESGSSAGEGASKEGAGVGSAGEGASALQVSEARAQMSALQTEIAAMQAQMAAQSRAAQFAQDVQTLEAWKRQGKMTPGEADAWRRIAEETPAAFAAARPALEARTPLPMLSRGGSVDGETARAVMGEANPDADRLDQMTRAYAKENRMPYPAAFSAVCKAHPELARSYRAGMEAN